jgi:acetyl esterase/lipase
MPWVFLAVTLIGACFTLNAYIPQRRKGFLAVPSFFAGWLTAELSAHHFAWQLAATVFFLWAGALAAWPGWVGLGITLVSWAGLFALVSLSQRTEEVVEKSLADALGPRYRDSIAAALADRSGKSSRRDHLVIPFLLYDRDVEVVRDIPFAEGAKRRHQLDVYRPRAGAREAPVLLQVHGGGWVIGDKRQQGLPLMLHLAARGWVCVATNYRLSPRATFPDHLIDVKRAIRWIRLHIAEYGGDPNFLAVTGGSAGGHLSSLATLTPNEPEYQPGFEDVDTAVRACVSFYGVYDFANRFGHQLHDGMTGFLERLVMKKRISEHPEAFERASPMHRIHAAAPPFFVIHGTHDSLVPVEEARCFVARLRERSNAPVAYAELPGAQHAFEVFHSLRTRHVVQGVDRFLVFVYSSYLAEREGLGGRLGERGSLHEPSLRTPVH